LFEAIEGLVDRLVRGDNDTLTIPLNLLRDGVAVEGLGGESY
jgi:hypothetical protein